MEWAGHHLISLLDLDGAIHIIIPGITTPGIIHIMVEVTGPVTIMVTGMVITQVVGDIILVVEGITLATGEIVTIPAIIMAHALQGAAT
jgi:hypothetical protein